MAKKMSLPMYATSIKRQLIDMTLSENPLGCSSLALKALRQVNIASLSQYPTSTTLINLIASKLKLTPQNILIDAGSEPIIKLFCQTFLNSADCVAVQSGSFPVFLKEVNLRLCQVALKTPAQLNTKSPTDYQAIILCSPNNPTGELIPQNLLKAILRNNQDSLILLDQANLSPLSLSEIKAIEEYPKLIILRSCSKLLGLAGLRLGFALANPAIIKRLRDTQVIFPVSNLAITLSTEAMKDTLFVRNTKLYLKKQRIVIGYALRKCGLSCTPSVTQNMYITSPQANYLVEQLKQQNVSVIPGSMFPGLEIPGFRISLRDKATNQKFIGELNQAVRVIRRYSD